ncbi:MAG: hypothetical protein AB7G37_07555, partial [Solirubrobacteraceae bacterium]
PAVRDELRTLGQPGRKPRIVAAERLHAVPDEPAPAGGLALTGVSVAGNVGGILRTAAAFRLPAVSMHAGCADPWGRKAQRVSEGAGFRAGLLRSAPDVVALRERTVGPLVAAVPRGGGDPRAIPADATVLLGEPLGGSRGTSVAVDLQVTVGGDGPVGLGVSAVAAVIAYALADARERVGADLRDPTAVDARPGAHTRDPTGADATTGRDAGGRQSRSTTVSV